MLLETNPERKVFLTASALQRFDRLKDRLKGVMINTIDGHFEEINALQDTASLAPHPFQHTHPFNRV